MKTILITFLILLISISSHSTGYVRINCQSENSRIVLDHFGFIDSVEVRALIYGPGFPHRPKSKHLLSGNNLYIYDDGVLFLLRNVFKEFEPSYPTPVFEIIQEEYPHRLIERGVCEIH